MPPPELGVLGRAEWVQITEYLQSHGVILEPLWWTGLRDHCSMVDAAARNPMMRESVETGRVAWGLAPEVLRDILDAQRYAAS